MKTINLKSGERIDDLQRNGYGIIQNPERFCFGMDAVLLSSFAKAKPGERVLDLGCGNGIIPILMEAKTKGEKFFELFDKLLLSGISTPSIGDSAGRYPFQNTLKMPLISAPLKPEFYLFAAKRYRKR